MSDDSERLWNEFEELEAFREFNAHGELLVRENLRRGVYSERATELAYRWLQKVDAQKRRFDTWGFIKAIATIVTIVGFLVVSLQNGSDHWLYPAGLVVIILIALSILVLIARTLWARISPKYADALLGLFIALLIGVALISLAYAILNPSFRPGTEEECLGPPYEVC